MLSSYLVLLATTLACGLLGVFLVLRNLSMVGDAISHSVLLGIVLAFFITKDLDSPLLIIGAAIFGLLTVVGIELLGKSKKVAYNDAIGVVFPLFFALAVILITKFARNVHLDTDIVLMGEVIFSSLNTIDLFGIEVSLPLLKMILMLFLNIIFILAFYQKLKLSSFDSNFVLLQGMQVGLIYYSFMALTSLTAVLAFDAVGSILVLTLFIVPPASAYLLVKDLYKMIKYSVIIGIIDCSIGTLFAIVFNSTMTGMCAFIAMLVFIFIFLFNKKGLIITMIDHRRNQNLVYQDMLVIHIGNHLEDGRYEVENLVSNLPNHFNWSINDVNKIAQCLIDRNLIYLKQDRYCLTSKGQTRYDFLKDYYKLR